MYAAFAISWIVCKDWRFDQLIFPLSNIRTLFWHIKRKGIQLKTCYDLTSRTLQMNITHEYKMSGTVVAANSTIRRCCFTIKTLKYNRTFLVLGDHWQWCDDLLREYNAIFVQHMQQSVYLDHYSIKYITLFNEIPRAI